MGYNSIINCLQLNRGEFIMDNLIKQIDKLQEEINRYRLKKNRRGTYRDITQAILSTY